MSAARALSILAAAALALAGCSTSSGRAHTPASAADVCGPQDLNLDPGVTEPKLIHRVEPTTLITDPSPAYACVEATVRTDGSVADLKVLRASTPDMATKALAAVREWRYAPATRNGTPVEAPIRIAFFIRVTSK